MVLNIRAALYKSIVDALSRGTFVPTDFLISADSPPRSKDTTLRIEHQYSKAYFAAQLPSQKTTMRNGVSSERVFNISVRPGMVNIEESDSTTTDTGLLLLISDWLDRLAEDLSQTPAAREMSDLEAQIKDLSAKIGLEDEDEPLEPEQQQSLIDWIRQLEATMAANFEAAEKNARVLEKKIEILRVQVDALCVIVGSQVSKKGALRALFGRLMRWAKQPDNAQLLKDASSIVTKLLVSGDHHH